MARMTREDLEARVDDLEAENQMLQDKLDSIVSIVEEDEETDDDED